MKGEGGFALIITLLVTALLVALSVEFVNEVYVDTSLSHNFVAGQQASLLASSGIDGGVALLKFTSALPDHQYSSLADSWAKPIHLEDEKGALTVTVVEESGKLNLNMVAPSNGVLDANGFYYGTAVRLAKKLKLSPDLWEALADWVDLNDEPHPGGAETPYYSALKPPYKAKNAFLDTVEELGLVKGFTWATRELLGPFVTVYGADANLMAASPVNINTAPKELLSVLHQDMTDELADRIIEYRKVTPFKSPTDLSNVPGIGPIAQGLQGYVSVLGKVYRLRSEARVGESRRVVEAVVRMNGSMAAIIYWREY